RRRDDRVPSFGELQQVTEQRDGDEGEIDAEEEPVAVVEDLEAARDTTESPFLRLAIDDDGQAAIRVAWLRSGQDDHVVADRAEAGDGVVEERRPFPGQEGLVGSHPAALPARDHEPDVYARLLNDHVISNSAATTPSPVRPVDRATQVRPSPPSAARSMTAFIP